jgi:hypothetical protein
MRQSGQTLVMFALTLAFVFVGLIALVGDAAVILFQYSQVNSAALLGVQTGAADVNLDAFYGGSRTLDTGNAQTACESAVRQQFAGSSVLVTCNVIPGGTGITATVSKTVNLPVPIWGPTFTVQVTRTGQAVFGGRTPCTPQQPCP